MLHIGANGYKVSEMATSYGKTNIQVQVTTRDRLAELGSKKDTYDDIINRLIEHYEQS